MHKHFYTTKFIAGAIIFTALIFPNISFAVCTVGFSGPASNIADTGGDGNGFQSNPANAYTANDVYAVDTNSGTQNGTQCTSPGKDRHKFFNYGFSLPSGATIDGIEVQLVGKVDSTTGAPKMCAELSWDGGSNWTIGAEGVLTTPTLKKSNTVYTLGGPTNTWGRNWAFDELSNSNFLLRLTNVASNNSRDFSLDFAGVKVTCTAPTLPQVSFATTTSFGSENLAISDILVSLNMIATQTVTVDWAVVSGGTAMYGTDYSIHLSTTTSGVLSFEPGEVSKTIRIATVSDNDATEGDETVMLELSNPSANVTLGSNTSLTFTIYDTPPRGIVGDFTADIVLGQRDHTESTTNTVVPKHVFNAGGVVVDRSVGSGVNGRAYVWDGGNNRILGFNLDSCYATPGEACMPALVIGQPTGTGYGSCNQDASMSRYPYLAPASASTICGTAAWYISPKEMARRSSMAVDQTTGDLYVPDFENNRVLVFEKPFDNSPGKTPTIADDVIGQDDFSGVYCNKVPYKRKGGDIDPSTPIANPSASSLCAMSEWYSQGFGVALDTWGNLWVADGGNNRVLRFPKNLATNKISKSADLVLGQSNFTSRTGGTGLTRMQAPTSLAFGPTGKLYVADGSTQNQDNSVYPNSRVIVFTPQFTNGMTGTLFSGGGSTEFKRPYITSVSAVSGLNGLWISHWVPDVSTPTYIPQHFEVEQFDWNGNLIKTLPVWLDAGGGFVANSFDSSIDVDVGGNVLVPGGRDANNVVIYSAPYSVQPTTLLPPSFMYNPTSNSHLFYAGGIATASNQLYVADGHRIMIWNNLDYLTNGKAADSFIGQVDFNSSNYLFNGNNSYAQMKVDSKQRLWVASNNRIFVYQTPLYTWSKPIKVIRGPLGVLNSTDQIQNLSVNGREIGIVPTVTADDQDFLWVSQPFEHRVLRIRDPLGTTPLVDVVLGQTNITDTNCNHGASVPQTALDLLCYPYNLSLDQNKDLYVSDHITEGAGNMRMLMFQTSSTSTFPVDNSDVLYAPFAYKAFPSPQATYEAAFNTGNGVDRMIVGYDSYGGLSPFVGIYENPGLTSVTTPTCILPSGESDCYLNDHTTLAGATTFDQLGNLYVGDANRTKVFIYKQPFSSTGGSQGPQFPEMTQISSHITMSSDDAYTCGSYTTTNDAFTMVGHNTQCPGGSADAVAGLRFNSINIPSMAIIDHATIIYKPTWFNSYTESLNIKINGVADANANPTTFSTEVPLNTLPLISDGGTGLPVTVYLDDSENGLWKTEHWHAAPNLTSIVQNMIGQPGWVSGNSMAFLISNDGTPNERSFIGFDYNPDEAPILYIQYH
ncbi:MAG: Calx-beta domain-containing protein [bacterium]|nr:Calx-beta domain-containing protein [bacterium]